MAVFVAGLAMLAARDFVPADIAIALEGGAAAVAIAGWLDDRGELGAKWRLAAHLGAAAWAVYWLGGMPSLVLGTYTVELGGAGSVLATLTIAWAVNFYNFMDGVDGIAAGEALVVGAVGTALLAPLNPPLAAVCALLAGGSAGFLPWNWSPARIFLGDVGSGFLGYLFGALALASEHARAVPAVVWILLLGVFFVDATLTLLIRMVRGERWYAAHRTHAYQRAAQNGWTHRQVTCATLLLTGALAAVSWLCVNRPRYVVVSLAVSTFVLVALYRWIVRRPGADSRFGNPVENTAR